jgi:uncharacterized protein (DUF1697 family)
VSQPPPRIALLRAVNVGGRSMPMADLRAMVTELGFTDVRTLLQSGNLVFRGDGDDEAVETRLEAESEKRFGFHADYLVRDLHEWDAAIAGNPFTDEARDDPARLVVVTLKSAVGAEGLAALRAAIKGREYAEAKGRAAYVVYPDGQGASKLTISVIERALKTRGTARNWNTVLKLAALARG